MGVSNADGAQAEGTLAHASQRNLHKLLSKSRSAGASSDFSHLAATLQINANPTSSSVVCGAAAVTTEGRVDDQVNAAPTAEDDLDWDDGQSYQEVHRVASSGEDAGAASDNDIVEVSVEPGRQATRRPRRAFDKREAQLLHRTHLLLLLGRAMLFDRAADAPLVQASMVSLLPDGLFIRSGPGAVTTKELHTLCAWFCTTFKHKAAQLDLASPEAKVELPPARGAQGFIDALLAAAAALEGAAEELCALMVALLRCHNQLARTVRACTPLPLAPSSTLASAASAAAKGATSRRAAPKRRAAVSSSKRKTRDDAQHTREEHRPEEQQPKRSKKQAAAAAAAKKRKNNGDEELERQLAMAELATAAATPAKSEPPEASPAPAPAPAPGGAWQRGREANGTAVCWVEVFVGSSEAGAAGRWVHVDPLHGWVDRPQGVEEAYARGQPLSYVVACMQGGAKDVTKRYCGDVRATQRLRDEAWWQETLAPLRFGVGGGGRCGAAAVNGAGGQHNGLDGGFVKEAPTHEEAEDQELQRRATAQLETAPMTLRELDGHPLFVRREKLKKYEALRPGAAQQGLVRGVPYYARKDVSPLHSASVWRREGRRVLEDQLAAPAKRVPKRGARAASTSTAAAEGELDDDVALEMAPPAQEATAYEGPMTDLYGDWQTEADALAPVTDGVIPRNEYGNVEVPPHVPMLAAGLVHLNHPYITKTCKALGVEYAAAMVGFERRRGGSVPVLQGVVVCEEHAPAVLEAYWEQQRKREEQAAAKRRALGNKLWARLIRAVLAKAQLEAEQPRVGAPAEEEGPVELDVSDAEEL